MAVVSNATYDFHCVLTSTTDIANATVKLVENGDDGNFFFEERVSLSAYDPYDFTREGLTGIDASAVKLVLDFGGNPADTEVTLSDFSFVKR